MKRILISSTALAGFLGVWLALPADVEPSGRSLAMVTDELSTSAAQAEKPGEKASEKTDDKAANVPDAKPVVSADDEDSCLPRTALEDLVKRRKDLDAREAELGTKEQDLATREKAVQDELKKIQAIRAEVEKIQGARTKEEDEKVVRIVEVLETMNPKAASQVISTYDERLAVQAMSRMSTPKLSKIMNVMETKRSARLMELMAGKGTPATASEASVPGTNAVTK